MKFLFDDYMEDKMTEFKNNDAYKVMTYRCQKCGFTEKIWNSRNAVSPFSVGCPMDYCDGTSYHIMWNHDIVDPNYKLKPGQRYFADYTKERAEEVTDRFIERFRDRFSDEEEIESYRLKQIHSLLHSECAMDILTYQPENKIFTTTCHGCRVERIRSPIAGSCPCCFGIMKELKYERRSIYKCLNKKCQRICSVDYLSGFWSGWEFHNDYYISEIKHNLVNLENELVETELNESKSKMSKE